MVVGAVDVWTWHSIAARTGPRHPRGQGILDVWTWHSIAARTGTIELSDIAGQMGAADLQRAQDEAMVEVQKLQGQLESEWGPQPQSWHSAPPWLQSRQ